MNNLIQLATIALLIAFGIVWWKTREVSNRHNKVGVRRDISPRIVFKSAMEANIARLFNYNKERWSYEPESFYLKRWPWKYTPDFYVAGVGFVECKGIMDKRSQQSLNQFKKQYLKERLELIDWPTYQKINQRFSHKVPNWE